MHLHLLEHPSRVKGSQTDRCNHDHNAIQPDEVWLGLHDRIAPPFGHLADTEDATGEDGDVGQGQTGDEEPKALAVEELDGSGLEA